MSDNKIFFDGVVEQSIIGLLIKLSPRARWRITLHKETFIF